MGQRLICTIKTNEKTLCNIYFHWSAYTYSALLETKKIIDCIYNHKDETEKELLLRLIRFCEENGGGIEGTEDEFEYIQNLYRFLRNNCLSFQCRRRTASWLSYNMARLYPPHDTRNMRCERLQLQRRRP